MKNESHTIKSPKPSYGLDISSLRDFRFFLVVKGEGSAFSPFTTVEKLSLARKIRNAIRANGDYAEFFPLEIPRHYFKVKPIIDDGDNQSLVQLTFDFV